MNKKITLLLLGLFAVACNSKSANAFSSPFSIDNEQFTVSPSTYGINNASANSTINTTANPNGFENRFDFASDSSNTFLLLGATDVANTIDGGNNTALDSVNSDATSAPFILDAGNIDAGLKIKFDWSFQGTNSLRDSFYVGIQPEGDDGSNLVDIINELNYGGGSVDQDIDFTGLGLTPGNYEMKIFLTESNIGSGNSAAGFDNIFVSEVAPPPPATPVPFGAAPNTGIFILGSLYAGSSYLKRRKMSS